MDSIRDFNQVSKKTNLVFNIILIIFGFICVFPFILIIILSFTDETTLATNGYQLFPDNLSLAAYEFAFKSSTGLLNSYGVSIFLTVVGTAVSVFMTALYAYGISRKSFEYRKFFTFFAFFTMLFASGLVPTYMVVTKLLGLRDSIWALIWPLVLNPFNIMILKTFYQTTIPDSVIESAQIDGAKELTTFFKIVIPISLPGIATVALFTTLAYWNDWFNAMLYIDNKDLVPLQYMLIRIQNNMEYLLKNASIIGSSGGIEIGKLPTETLRMAMVILATGPIVLAYPFFQRYFINGLTIGAVKE